MKLYSTRQAAAYLGMKLPTFRWHVHVKRDLQADQKIGPALAFSQQTLDKFRESRKR